MVLFYFVSPERILVGYLLSTKLRIDVRFPQKQPVMYARFDIPNQA